MEISIGFWWVGWYGQNGTFLILCNFTVATSKCVSKCENKFLDQNYTLNLNFDTLWGYSKMLSIYRQFIPEIVKI